MTTLRYQANSRILEQVARATLEETRKEIVATAYREHRKVLDTDPRPTRWTQFVDGVANARFESVKGDGVITVDYQRLDIVTQFALEVLFERSPVLTGDYRNGHTIFVDGIAVPNLKAWNGGEIIITNMMPYARKIELGTMRMTVSGTDHVYAQAEQIVKRRYGNVADIKFTYRSVVGAGVVAYRPTGSAKAARSRRGGVEQVNRSPALVIAPRGTLPGRRRFQK